MSNPQNKNLPTQTNQSSDKLLNMLEILTGQNRPLRLQDIASRCGMNPSTALRFLTALQRRNYVAQNPKTSKYYLTFKICGLAQNLTSSLDIRGVALPFLRDTADVFSESCNLAVERDMMVTYIEVVISPNKTLMTTQRIGNIAPLHCTGVGKLFLTQYSPAELQYLLAVKKLTAFTEFTITDVNGLEEELRHVRQAGYAFDNQECEAGARCVAAPIYDYTGRIVAGISVSGPAVRMTDEHIYAHLPFLLETAARISERMGRELTA